ncbi:MAG TPA: hypothetical protein VGE07_10530 [Herpetosiphonaceae bacterium]
MGRWRTLGLMMTLLAALLHGALPAPAQQPVPLEVRQYAPLIHEGTYATMRLSLKEQLRWYNPASNPRSYDVVIVADYSGSMRECYSNHNTCSAPNRRIDYQTPVLVRFVKELLVTRNGQGADNRLAFVRHGVASGAKSIAVSEIPLTDTVQTALNKFRALIGDDANPRIIPNSEVVGGSASAAGLLAAKELLANGRAVDANGNPVAKMVLLLIDGVPSVFVDPPFDGYQNRSDLDPFRCQSTITSVPVMDDPLTQYVCPAEDHPANTTGVRPPLRAVVEIADEIRGLYGAQIYGVLIGSPNGHTTFDLRMPVFTEHYFQANTPSQLDAMMNFIPLNMAEACQEFAAAARPAAGARVELFNSGGTRVFSGTTDADGMISERLAPGIYTLGARHLGVVAPLDPQRAARNYTKLMTDLWAGPSLSAPISVTLPISGAARPPIRALLSLTNPNDAKCP